MKVASSPRSTIRFQTLIVHCDTECEPIPLPTAGPSTTLCSDQEAPAAGMNQQAVS
ncbi:unnamed protein product [Dibothriocephalus latus]|uniref:Uncharacterized protein n=1 Tax=Dibothriocephalus latus TaxID=60516 RepID=A0A3P7P3E7_DIBLA|nr:unnamed protein product [Dibothriocephalus latus]